MRSPIVYVSVYPLMISWMPKLTYMKLGMYIMAPESIATAYFINLSHQIMYPPVIARQRLGKNFTAAMNTHTEIEEFLDWSCYMSSVSYQRKVIF
jgi:hypothetical protein